MWEHERLYFKHSLRDWLRYSITFGGHRFLVGRPTHEIPGLIGGEAWGLVGCDPLKKRFAFLKDAWQSISQRAEEDVLFKLNRAGVRFVPTLVAAGYVRE